MSIEKIHNIFASALHPRSIHSQAEIFIFRVLIERNADDSK